MAKSSLGTLTVNILAKTAGIEKGTRKGRAAFRSLEKEVRQVEKAIGTSMKVASAAVAGFAAATAYAVKQQYDLIGTQSDLAKSMNATVTGIRAVNLAAEDKSIEGLDGSLARLTRRLGAAERGAGPAAQAVKDLGLDIERIGKVDADEKLAIIADAIQLTGVSAQKATRYLQDLGFEQRGVYEVFRDGGDAIRNARLTVEEYGLAVSNLDAEKVNVIGDAFNTAKRTADGMITTLSTELAGILAQSAQDFQEWANESVDGVDRVRSSIDAMISSISYTIDVLDSLKRIGTVTWESMRAGVATVMAGFAKLVDLSIGSATRGMSFLIKQTKDWALPTNAIKFAFDQLVNGISFTLDGFERIYNLGDIAWNGIRAGVSKVSEVVLSLASSISGTLLAGLNKLAQFGAKFNLPGAEEAAALFDGFGSGIDKLAADAKATAEKAAKDLEDAIERGMNPKFKASGAFRDLVDQAKTAGSEIADKLGIPTAEEFAAVLDNSAERISRFSDVATDLMFDAANQSREAWSEALNSPLEGGQMFEDWVARAKALGEELAQARLDAGATTTTTENDPVEQTRVRLSAELQALVDYQKEKEQLLYEQYEREQEMLNEALEQGKISTDDHLAALINSEKKYNDQIDKMEANRNKMKLKGANQFFGNLSTLMNTESRKLFEIGKAAAYAGAVVDGFASAVAAYKAGMEIGGPAAPSIAAAFAAASVAATGAQIAAIASTQFGGGTAAVSNTQAVNAVTEPVQQQAPVATQEIYLRGIDPDRMYDGAQVLEALNRQIEDGGRIVGVI